MRAGVRGAVALVVLLGAAGRGESGGPPARVLVFVQSRLADDPVMAPVLCAERHGKRVTLRRGADCMGKVPDSARLELGDGSLVRAKRKRRAWLCPAGEEDAHRSYEVPSLVVDDGLPSDVAVWPPGAATLTMPVAGAADEPDLAALEQAVGQTREHWALNERLDADVDGDGTAERVYALHAVRSRGGAGPSRVFVIGGAAAVELKPSDVDGGAPIELIAATDLDGDGRAEIIVRATELVAAFGDGGKRVPGGFGCYFM
jgi:hypothetical protein